MDAAVGKEAPGCGAEGNGFETTRKLYRGRNMEAIKKDMTRYWSQRVEKFSALRCREMDSEKYGRWLDELTRRLPAGRKLNILDIGTGTGFFAFLLAQRGHTVTGIDLTPSMVAERNAWRSCCIFPLIFVSWMRRSRIFRHIPLTRSYAEADLDTAAFVTGIPQMACAFEAGR